MTSLMGVLDRAIPRGRFIRSVVVLVGGTAAAQALLLVAMPLITRLYNPVEFGVMAGFTAVLSITGVLGGLCYERAIPLPSDDADAAHLAVLSLSTYLVVAVLAMATVLMAGEDIASWVNTPALVPFLWLMPLSLLMLGLYQNMTFWALRTRSFVSLSQSKFSQTIGLVGTQAGLGLLLMGPAGLLVGDLIGRICGVIAFFSLTWGQWRHAFENIRLRELRRLAWRYRKCTLGILPGFLCMANLQAPVLVVAACFGPAEMALVALAQQVIATPLTLLGNAVSQAFGAETAKPDEQVPGEAIALLRKILVKLSLFGALVLAAVALGAPSLFALLFGETWRAAGTVLQYLAPMFVMYFILSPVAVAVQVLECQEVLLYRELVRSLAFVLAIPFVLWLDGGFHTTMSVLGVAGFIGYLVYGAIGWNVIVNRWGPQVSNQADANAGR